MIAGAGRAGYKAGCGQDWPPHNAGTDGSGNRMACRQMACRLRVCSQMVGRHMLCRHTLCQMLRAEVAAWRLGEAAGVAAGSPPGECEGEGEVVVFGGFAVAEAFEFVDQLG